MHLLSKTSGGAALNEADLAFVADMIQRPSFNKEQRENSGHGLLHIAAAGENAGLVSFLVQNGVDVHGRSGAKGQGSSALYIAVQNKRLENVRILLDLSVDVHVVGGVSRESPLCAAAMAGSVEIVELLLAKGANPNDLRSGHPLLHRLAPYASRNAIAQLLMMHGALISTNPNTEKNALHWAAHGGNHVLVKALLDAGAIMDTGNTFLPMSSAIIDHKVEKFCGRAAFLSDPADDIKVALLLLEHGATLDLLDKDGCSLLHHAAKRGSTLICDFLVERGADVNAKAKDGRTPLHMSLNLETTAYLVDKGSDVRAKDKKGLTPLHLMVSGFHVGLAKYLLDKGADVNGGVISAAEGGTPTPTPLLYVLRHANDMLSRDGQNYQTNIKLSEQTCQEVVVMSNLLLDRGSNINGTTTGGIHGLSALHCAACTGDVALVTRLLDMGAEINAKIAGISSSPLHFAVRYRRVPVISLLIARGADVNPTSDFGDMPHIELIRQFDFDDSALGIVKSLLDAGADVNA